jgi:predicted nucleic acid-binding protein
VKLVLDEPDSAAMLRWFTGSEMVVTSQVGAIETFRAVRRLPHDPAQLRHTLGQIDVVELDERTAVSAARLSPPSLRTLDAIHLATAIELGPELEALVTYDDRLAAAARALGLPVVRPA